MWGRHCAFCSINLCTYHNPNLKCHLFLNSPDINECQLNLDNCEQVCVNLVPGFQCDCNAGLTLLISDGVSCVRKYQE